jgi:hypothetical protein
VPPSLCLGEEQGELAEWAIPVPKPIQLGDAGGDEPGAVEPLCHAELVLRAHVSRALGDPPEESPVPPAARPVKVVQPDHAISSLASQMAHPPAQRLAGIRRLAAPILIAVASGSLSLVGDLLRSSAVATAAITIQIKSPIAEALIRPSR